MNLALGNQYQSEQDFASNNGIVTLIIHTNKGERVPEFIISEFITSNKKRTYNISINIGT